MPVRPADDPSLRHAANLLRGGGLVAMPTETVYGLAANALDPIALARVFEAKGRPRFDPLIVHIAQPGDAERWVTGLSPLAGRLMQRFWPGPLTLVLPKVAEAAGGIPDLATAGLPSVAIRCPGHPIARRLIELTGRPLAAPSANPFAAISPTSADHVAASLGDRVDLILDAGPSATGIESTVLSLLDATPTLLRPGGTPLEAIEDLVGPVHLPRPDRGDAPDAPRLSPGSLTRHYAPHIPLTLHDTPVPLAPPTAEGRGLLVFQHPGPHATRYAAVEVLSRTGNPVEAAAHLFAALHRLDAATPPLRGIDAHRAPDASLGLAINDRLRRAAAA